MEYHGPIHCLAHGQAAPLLPVSFSHEPTTPSGNPPCCRPVSFILMQRAPPKSSHKNFCIFCADTTRWR